MQLVDLSQDIYQGMQVYPGHLKTVVFDHASHEETAPRFEGGFSFQTKGFMINDNGPTHVDSFSHLDPDPSARDDRSDVARPVLRPGRLPRRVARRCRRGHHRRAPRGGRGRGGRHASSAGDILLLHTGTHGRYAGERRYLTDFPGLGETGSQWIYEHGVKTFGVDSPTPDNPTSKSYPCHMMCRATTSPTTRT